ncbi:DUF6799 domain-containing protein [Olleya sp. ITB9]|uniref:DUF6799 domain-containing protein n=1 Tax=Olleya sp. ITB9 TaxID=1715648 RepID=UPI0006D156E6|nr:DUF6799 domain-containing protein [Olleya sp. ITB9]
MKNFIMIAFALFLGLSTVQAQDAKQIEDANYVILLDSKVYHYTATGVEQLRKELKLNNGTLVKTDGTYITDKKTLKLEDGQCLGMSGTLYIDQETLNKKLIKYMKQS